MTKLRSTLLATLRTFPSHQPKSIVCEYVFPVAASHSKKQKLLLYGQPYQQHNGGDVDNLLKPVADAMQKENWLADDCQLAGQLGVKRYQREGETPGTILTILG